MKGWRPSAAKARKPDRAFQAGVFLPDIGSIVCLYARHRAFGPKTRVPLAPPATPPAAQSDKWRPSVHDCKRRQPFTCFKKSEDAQSEDGSNDRQPRTSLRRRGASLRQDPLIAALSFPAGQRSERESRLPLARWGLLDSQSVAPDRRDMAREDQPDRLSRIRLEAGGPVMSVEMRRSNSLVRESSLSL
jgi:hypothetical protein